MKKENKTTATTKEGRVTAKDWREAGMSERGAEIAESVKRIEKTREEVVERLELSNRIQKLAQEYTPHHCTKYTFDGMAVACEFVRVFGIEAGRDLIAAVNWFTAEGYERPKIMALVNHDLNGIYDRFPDCFLPRSNGYQKHWNCSPHNPSTFEQKESQ